MGSLNTLPFIEKEDNNMRRSLLFVVVITVLMLVSPVDTISTAQFYTSTYAAFQDCQNFCISQFPEINIHSVGVSSVCTDGCGWYLEHSTEYDGHVAIHK